MARRRYLAVDPDNRLVADSLEADWNNALRALQTAREDYDRASAAAAAALTNELKDRIRSLATDFPALWANPDTPQRDRKRMVRLLVDDVTLHKTDRIHLHVRLRGGQTTSLTVAIPPKPGSSAKPTPTPSPRSTGSSKPTPTPRPPTHSTPPVTAPARASRSPPASCSKRAAATTCPATPSGSEPTACSPKPSSPHGWACTRVPSRAGPRPESSTPTRQTTRMSDSTSHQPRAIPSPPDKAAPSEDEFPPNPRQEVHYEAKPLSKLSPTVPIDGAAPISARRSPYRSEVNCDPASE